jgi:hypothetical protein
MEIIVEKEKLEQKINEILKNYSNHELVDVSKPSWMVSAIVGAGLTLGLAAGCSSKNENKPSQEKIQKKSLKDTKKVIKKSNDAKKIMNNKPAYAAPPVIIITPKVNKDAKKIPPVIAEYSAPNIEDGKPKKKVIKKIGMPKPAYGIPPMKSKRIRKKKTKKPSIMNYPAVDYGLYIEDQPKK